MAIKNSDGTNRYASYPSCESLLRISNDSWQQRSKAQYAKIEPYIHGAIYAANPYMMHTMEHINVEYLLCARYGMSSVKDLAEKMEYSAFGNWQYDRYLSWLKKEAKKQGCGVEILREQVDESVYDMEL